jgi:flagellar protein FliO/FliZ
MFLTKRIFLMALLLFVFSHSNAAEHIATASSINMSDYFKVLFGLVFVIGLFLLTAFLFKRYGNGTMAGRGQIRLIDGLHLGNKERLVLVELKDKQILLSITPGQINKLDTVNIIPATEDNNA